MTTSFQMTEFLNGEHASTEDALRLIDKAATQGHDTKLLRWRMSPDQLRAVTNSMASFAAERKTPIVALNHLAIGTWCSLPTLEDRQLPVGSVVLEAIA